MSKWKRYCSPSWSGIFGMRSSSANSGSRRLPLPVPRMTNGLSCASPAVPVSTSWAAIAEKASVGDGGCQSHLDISAIRRDAIAFPRLETAPPGAPRGVVSEALDTGHASRSGQSRALKYCARRWRSLMPAAGALQQRCPHRPRFVVPASRTTKTLRPAELTQILSTGLLGGETRLELGQIPRIIFHFPDPTSCGHLSQVNTHLQRNTSTCGG